jgi:hypothetical protein
VRSKVGRDLLLRRTWAARCRPACAQVSGQVGISASDRECPALTGRSGTQRARRLRSRTTVGTSPPWCSSSCSELRITRVSRCVARRFIVRASFMFAGCCWLRSLAVDGSSGAGARSCVGQVLGGVAPPHDGPLMSSGLPVRVPGPSVAGCCRVFVEGVGWRRCWHCCCHPRRLAS